MSNTTTEIKAIKDAIPADLMTKFKAILKNFNIGAPVQQAAPAAPAAPDPTQPAALNEATLADGTTKVKYDTPTLAQGSVVTVVSPEGELPLPAGEYQLQDGSSITVVNTDGKSVVESIKPATAPAAPAQPAMQSADVTVAQIAEINKILQGYKENFSKQATEKESLKKELEATNLKFTALEKNVTAFMQAFSEIIETPSAAPIETPKNAQKTKSINKYINRNN